MKIEIIGADEATRKAVAAHIESKTGIKPEVEPDKQAATGGHSPGPWSEDPEGEVAYTVEDAEGVPICDVYRETHGEANARLIASAPELLAALKSCVPFVEHVAAQSGGDGSLTLAQIRAAIAKAEGRAQ